MVTKKKKITVEFFQDHQAYCVLPLIKVRLGDTDEQMLALIDTGSEITLLDKAAADKANSRSRLVTQRTGEDFHISGFGGTGNCSDSEYFATFVDLKDVYCGSVPMAIEGAITDLSYIKEAMKEHTGEYDTVMIIGSDVLRRHKAKVDYKRKKVVFNDILCDR